MDYEKIIHSLVDSFIDNPEVLLIREEPTKKKKDIWDFWEIQKSRISKILLKILKKALHYIEYMLNYIY